MVVHPSSSAPSPSDEGGAQWAWGRDVQWVHHSGVGASAGALGMIDGSAGAFMDTPTNPLATQNVVPETAVLLAGAGVGGT